MPEQEQEPFNAYDASRKETAITKPSVPDYLFKAKEHVKQHPEVIRDIAPEMIENLQQAINTAEIDVPILGKVNVGEQFRKYQEDIFQKYPIARIFLDPNLPKAQEGVKDAPGQQFIPQAEQGQGEQPENEPEDYMTTQDVKEIIEFMADLSEQGLALPEIADAVWRDYRIEYHPLKIKRMLKAYYARPEEELERGEDTRESPKSLKIYQKLLEKNKELQKKAIEFEKLIEEKKINELVEQKVAELTPKIPIEVVKAESKGLIRRFLSWAW